MTHQAKRYGYGQGETFECDDGEFVLYTDYAAAIAWRDAAQRECERLEKSLKLYPDLNAINKDLQAANRAIKSMGEAADAELTKLREQVPHQTKCIDAQSATCARYAAQLDEAVGLLRRWLRHPVEDERTHQLTRDFLAAYDAKGTQAEGGRG